MDLLCLRCGAKVGAVDEREFHVLPASTLCLRCSHPAWGKTRARFGP